MTVRGKMLDKAKGFTIIEVALVLAIAGLIFLVVFLALPALQRSQRDTGRRQDVGKIVSALQSFAADNQSSNATTWAQISTGGTDGKGYVGTLAQLTAGAVVATFSKPASGTAYSALGLPTGSAANAYSQVYITGAGMTCGTGTASSTVVTGTARQQAVIAALESGGYYCSSM